MGTPTKAKRKTWSTAEEKDFVLLCKERAIVDYGGPEGSHMQIKNVAAN